MLCLASTHASKGIQSALCNSPLFERCKSADGARAQALCGQRLQEGCFKRLRDLSEVCAPSLGRPCCQIARLESPLPFCSQVCNSPPSEGFVRRGSDVPTKELLFGGEELAQEVWTDFNELGSEKEAEEEANNEVELPKAESENEEEIW